jgi:glutamate-ammonia-ligase adenylyltransferase
MVMDGLAAANRMRAHAPFLARQMDRFPDVAAWVEKGDYEAALTAAHAVAGAEDGVARSLRRRRGAIALVTAAADLAGAWNVDRVTRALSDFALSRCRPSRFRGSGVGQTWQPGTELLVRHRSHPAL